MSLGRLRAAVVLALVSAGALVASPAWAAPTTQVVQGQVLRLVSTADWDAASDLLPGQSVQWDVAVSAESPDPGTVRIGISAVGDAALVLDASLCMQEWDNAGCPGGATQLKTAWSIPRDGVEVSLAKMADTEVAHLRLTVALGNGDDGSTQVRVHARGVGETAVIGPDGGLASTGMTPQSPWILGAAGALAVAGVALIAWRRRRRSDDEAGDS
jgi:LPXTG-motif cell wall-anchored protein